MKKWNRSTRFNLTNKTFIEFEYIFKLACRNLGLSDDILIPTFYPFEPLLMNITIFLKKGCNVYIKYILRKNLNLKTSMAETIRNYLKIGRLFVIRASSTKKSNFHLITDHLMLKSPSVCHSFILSFLPSSQIFLNGVYNSLRHASACRNASVLCKDFFLNSGSRPIWISKIDMASDTSY